MLRLEAFTRLPRHEMIARVSQGIQSAGGSILDSRFFSNVSLFISAEISAENLPALRDAIVATEVGISTRSLESLEEHFATTEPPVIPFHLVVTFIHDEPDLRIPVPAVPG